MNELIKQQLKNCKVANIPQFDDNEIKILINKGTTLSVSPYQVHNFYLIELENYIINPPQTFTLAENWNGGRVPKHKHYKCEIAQVMGKMVKIIGCGYNIENDTDYNDVWEGWVPQEGIKLIKELK
jgi:hypothetical protein